MFEIINYPAVLVTAVVIFIFGLLWYALIFSKPWMKLAKITKKDNKKNPVQKMILGFLNGFVMALFTALFIELIGISDISDAVLIAFYLIIGFSLTTLFSDVIWAKKPLSLFLIDGAYRIISIILIGTIYVWWPY